MKQTDWTGVLTCARYAFAPNLYHYCGPDTGGDLAGYLKEDAADEKLIEYLAKFETLFPYLQVIAQANGIADPLDRRIVEAYWVGNIFLEKVNEAQTYKALTDWQHLDKRLPKKEAKWLFGKIDKKARLHHSFHVLNIFTRTGHRMVAHTTETMDQCRISWGKIISNINSKIRIKTQKLIYKNGKLMLVPVIKEVIVAHEPLYQELKAGNWVSVHWGIVCEQISPKAAKNLEYYTQESLKLANETI